MSVLRRLRLQDITITNSLDCVGLATLGSLSVTGNSDLTGHLTVSEDTTLQKRLILQGALEAFSSATFSNHVTISGPLTSTASASFSNTVNVDGALTVSGSTTLGGTTCSNLTVTGDSTLTGDLTVSGPVTLSSSLSTSGAATFGENVDVAGSLSVVGATTFSENLTVGGALITSGTTTFQGSVDLGDELVVAGVATFQSNASVGADLSVGGQTTVEGALQVNNDATVTGSLTVDGNTNLSGNLVVEGDVSVKGSLITKHQEEVFLGDSHFVINAGATSTGASASGITSVFQVDAVLASEAAVTFHGDDPTVAGKFSISSLTSQQVTEYDGCLVSVSGSSPYDGIYLLDGSNGSSPRLYSTDADGVDWVTRLPFLSAVSWGPGLSVTTSEQFPKMTISVIRVSHLLTDSTGAMWWARGASRSDFWSSGVSLYARVGMDGGSTAFHVLSSSGSVDFAVTALAVANVTATLNANDKLGTTRKIINNSGGMCTLAAPAGQTIDDLNTYELEDQEYIIVTKYDIDKYAII